MQTAGKAKHPEMSDVTPVGFAPELEGQTILFLRTRHALIETYVSCN